MDKKITEFLNRTGTKHRVSFKALKKYFDDDKRTRNVYTVTLSRNGTKISFTYGDSYANTDEGIRQPRISGIVECLTLYPPGSFENFCGDYGYDTDSRKAEKLWKAVAEEYEKLASIWNEDELKELQEIISNG